MGAEERGRLFGIYRNGLRRNTKNIRTVGVPLEIRTQHLPNTIQKRLSSLPVVSEAMDSQDRAVGVAGFHYKI
jgi:hypothetical protein